MYRAVTSPLDLAYSMPVPNVQELAAAISPAAASGGGEIPERYIRPEAEVEPVASAAGANDDELPVIDLSRLSLDAEFFDEDELAKLGLACREWGFFQIINHGVPEEVMNKMKDDLFEFFKLPLKERAAIKQIPGKLEGYGQFFIHSEEQKLDWADMISLAIQPPQRRDMRFWPTNPTTFRDTLEKYTSEIRKVANCLFGLMAKDLGVKPEVMLNIFNGKMQSVRINYYPPCKQASKVLGLSPHSDGTGLAVLLQANDVPGLQVKKDGRWFPLKPKPGAFIINIGDIMEMTTNGIYRSAEHRVVINREKERLSIATFHAPSIDAIVSPLPELLGEDGELYRATSVEEYAVTFFSRKLEGKSSLDSMKLTK